MGRAIVRSEKKKERVNYFINKRTIDRFKKVCEKEGMIMSVVVERAINEFCERKGTEWYYQKLLLK